MIMMKVVLIVLLLSQVYSSCFSLGFKPEWHPYIVKVIAHHKSCTLPPMIVNILSIPEVSVNIDENEVHRFFLPEVIMWDPIHQFPILFRDSLPLSCSEESCDCNIKFMQWQDGSTKRYNPRCLYGINGCVVLVCPIYCCSRGHMITACDPRILRHFPEREVIPFVLLHKCGITRQLQRLVFQLCSQGKSFSDIETLLLWSVQDHYAQQQLVYTHQTIFLTQSDCNCPSLPTTYISNDLISNIFIISFNEFKHLMFRDMADLSSEVISCDHTFKLAAHIGIHKCGKWVPQYDSLFIVQDEVGRVLFWQLSMGTSYGSIQDGMESLKYRMIKKEKNLKMVIIDNCCMWQKKLTDTFGAQTEVKLDLFHAVKRVTSAFSKRHPYFYPAVQEFRLVFRSLGDNGLQRTKHTPSPGAILRNLDEYVSKWNKIVDENGKPIMTKSVMDELVKLKVHIARGCLSGIPPHFGTNRNENLHRSLNKRLTGSCLGVEVAVALLATFFHSWNSKRKGCKIVSTPATFLAELASSMKGRGTICRAESSESSYSNGFGIGVSSKRVYTHNNVGQPKQALKNTCGALHQIFKEKDKGGLSETVYGILHHAFSSLYAEEVLNNLSDTHCKVSRLLPCQLGNALSLVEKEYADSDQQRLINVLRSFDLELVDVPADGDCLFTSIALYIKECLKTSSDFVQHLKSLDIDESSTTQSIILKLRGAMVQEWLQNKADYRPFFPISTFDEEAEHYRQSGMYASSLGDAMLLGLANVLHIQFIVFTSIVSWPHIPVHTRFPPLTENPLYLAYLHKGSGHYSLARKKERNVSSTEFSDGEIQSSVTLGSGCRCGRGRNVKNLERTNCLAEQAYASRCPCLKSNTGCSDRCRCQNCGNKYGVRPNQKLPEENSRVTRKKRPRHPDQDSLKVSGWKFMKVQNEQTMSGIWTPHEHYVFLSIVEYFRNQQSALKVEEIADMYESIRTTDFMSDILSIKATSQVKAKLDHFLKEEQVSNVCGGTNYFSVN